MPRQVQTHQVFCGCLLVPAEDIRKNVNDVTKPSAYDDDHCHENTCSILHSEVLRNSYLLISLAKKYILRWPRLLQAKHNIPVMEASSARGFDGRPVRYKRIIRRPVIRQNTFFIELEQGSKVSRNHSIWSKKSAKGATPLDWHIQRRETCFEISKKIPINLNTMIS